MMRRGFSLAELMVVLAIMGLLVVIVVPALGGLRANARDAQCRSNLRGLMQAQGTYAVDNGRFTAMWTAEEPISWRLRLSEYLPGTEGILHCSEENPERTQSDFVGGVEITYASYAMNGVMQFSRWNFDPTRVPRPASTIAIAEHGTSPLESVMTSDSYGVWSNGHLTNWFYSPEHDATRGYRHPGTGANVAMVDGHVRRLNHQQMMRESGHWYWFDALENDTATGGGSGEADAAMPDQVTPNPTPVWADVTQLLMMPSGPLFAPCGCPMD